MVLLGLAVGLALLFLGGDWLVTGAARLARSLGVSALVVGLTVVAIGTSTPELLVSLNAALNGSADIAVGNVVGSNIANIGLILGLSGLIYPISVHVTLVRREIPVMLAVAIAAYFMFRDGVVNDVDGIILIVGMVAFIAFMVFSSIKEQAQQSEANDEPATINRLKELLRLIVGIIMLVIGAQFTVDNAVSLAQGLGISERIIGITLVAVGTSLPELVTSVTAAMRRESDIAIGNVVGSNIFNILAILGITAVVQTINVAPQIIRIDAIVMLVFSVLLVPFVLNRKLERMEGIVFLVGYVGYIAYTVASGT